MQTLSESLYTFIGNRGFPCVGAKTALSQSKIRTVEAHDLRCPANDREILQALRTFVDDYKAEKSIYRSLLVLFHGPTDLDEEQFEMALWSRLQGLHEMDGKPWDPKVSSDPTDENFSFSLAGKAFYVVGMHPNSSRPSRRTPFPALAFNLHEQFEDLRASGEYGQMQKIVRRRDAVYSGSVNPMLADFQKASEALQYSGRQVSSDWVCPFAAKS